MKLAFITIVFSTLLLHSCVSKNPNNPQKNQPDVNAPTKITLSQPKTQNDLDKYKVKFTRQKNPSFLNKATLKDKRLEALDAEILIAFEDYPNAWEHYYRLSRQYDNPNYYVRSIELSYQLKKYNLAQKIAEKWHQFSPSSIESRNYLLKSSFLNKNYEQFFGMLAQFVLQKDYLEHKNYYFSNLMLLFAQNQITDHNFNYIADEYLKLEKKFPKIKLFPYLGILYANLVQTAPEILLNQPKKNTQLMQRNKKLIQNLAHFPFKNKNFYLNYYAQDFAQLAFGMGQVSQYILFVQTNYKETQVEFLTQFNILNLYIKALLFEPSTQNQKRVTKLINNYTHFITSNFFHNAVIIKKLIIILNLYQFDEAKKKLTAYLKKIVYQINNIPYQQTIYELLLTLGEYNFVYDSVTNFKYTERAFELERLILMLKSTIGKNQTTLNQITQIILDESNNQNEKNHITVQLAFFYEKLKMYKKQISFINWYFSQNNQPVEMEVNQILNFSKAISLMHQPQTYSNAVDILQKLHNDSPDNPNYMNSLAYSQLEAKQENLPLIYDLLNQSIKLNPNSIATIDSLAWYYFYSKEYKKSQLYLTYSFYHSYFENEIARHLFELYLKTNQIKKAQKIYNIITSKKKKEQDSYLFKIIQKYNFQPQ